MAQEHRFIGLMAQEGIDQLVAGQGEDRHDRWLSRQRMVLLSHTEQIFSGQIKRHDTTHSVNPTLWNRFWEYYFLHEAKITAFHRFRPADCLGTVPSLSTLTTLLPPLKQLPKTMPTNSNLPYVVASQRDKRFLVSKYTVDSEQIAVIQPSARRYIHFKEAPCRENATQFTVLADRPSANVHTLIDILKERNPKASIKLIKTHSLKETSPEQWHEVLSKTAVLFYLIDQPFDWPLLALEAFYWNIPVVYSATHHYLIETLGDNPLLVTKYLVESPPIDALDVHTRCAKRDLENHGAFEPYGMAHQYQDAFRRYFPELVGRPATDEPSSCSEMNMGSNPCPGNAQNKD